ncbi:type II toxin-antitoxin system VapC family toxin [Candidatus Bathyarchaeota archaeon]|nr:type II toxin-antitoxin system VapC family toxin [Candidatus Bathyarchaeota archaeon]
MPYIDSNVFIYPVIYQTEAQQKAKKAKEILHKIENGELSAYTSTLTWDEVVWVISRVMGRNDGIAQGRKLLGFPNLKFINADENVLTQAQTLIDKYKLSPRDSIHVASALVRNIKAVISDDADFDQVQEIKRTPL